MNKVKPRARWQSGATIKDVAQHAKVSPMTVSRVLNNEPVVKAATREKVMEAVKALNYRPNFSARSLAKARSFFIGLLYDNPSAGYISEFLNGAVIRCRADRYHLVLENCGPSSDDWDGEVEDVLTHANVDGVIVLPPVCDYPSVLKAVEKLGAPFVRIAPDTNQDATLSVRIDDRAAASQMTQYLLELGHTRIGFIKGHPNQGASREREAGFLDAMSEAGLTVPSEHMAQGYFSYKSGLTAAEALLGAQTPPTAIFASNDDMAAAVIAMARKFGLDVPEDLTVVGFDDTEMASTTWPALTTVHQPIREMAERAVDSLVRAISDESCAANKDDQHWVLDCTIVTRDSSGPPKT